MTTTLQTPQTTTSHNGAARALHALRDVFGDMREAQERLLIINSPWTWDYIHQGVDADGLPEVHGHVTPQRFGLLPVTRSGWCACHLREQAAIRY